MSCPWSEPICTLAIDVVESTGQLSRFFGAGGGNFQSDTKLAACANTFAAQVLSSVSLYTLDDSTPACDPDSPHFSDMTQVFSDQGWLVFPYRMRDIKKDTIDSISLSEKR